MNETAKAILTTFAGSTTLLLVGVYACIGLLYWKRPLWLLGLYQEADSALKFPKTIEVLAKRLPFVDDIVHSRRVLDAWVEQHAEKAAANFATLPTVREREIHLFLPVELEHDRGKAIIFGELKPTELQPVFSRGRGCVLIRGEGGVGKTSWACQLGRWAIEHAPGHRLAPHRMLPVIVEEDVSSPESGLQPLLNHIRGKLEALAGTSRPVPDRVFDALLRTGRVLVILDHYSELGRATRERVRPGDPDFPFAALVVTARTDERLGNQPRWVLNPCRIEADKLYKFLTDYLRFKGSEEAFPTQAEFFDACTRLSNLVGKRDITPLLARMFADLMVNASVDGSWDDLPRTVPDLIAEYVTLINRSVVEGRRPDEQVQADLRAAAFACVQETMRPGEADKAAVLKVLAGAEPVERLQYLEQRLQLVRTVAHSTKVRITLDPIAEYMAATELVLQSKNKSAFWERFFQLVGKTTDSPITIRSFLIAVRDVCRNRSDRSKVLEDVAERVRNFIGDDGLEDNEEVQELIRALKSRSQFLRQSALQSLAEDYHESAAPAVPAIISCLQDTSTRSEALNAIKAIGPSATAAVPFLIKILEHSLVWSDQSRAADALGSIGPAANAAIPVLRRALQHDMMPVRREAAEALGLIDPTASDTIQALRRVATEPGQVELYAAFALAKGGDDVPARLAVLCRVLEENDRLLCHQAAKLLGRLGPIAESAAPRLSSFLGRNESTFMGESISYPTVPEMRRSAAASLVQIGKINLLVLSHIIELFHAEADLANKAADLVVALGTAVVPDLCRGLEATVWDIRFLSAYCLGELATQIEHQAPVVDRLVKILTSDGDSDVRENAAGALGMFGKAAISALPALESALQDKAENVRSEAAAALQKVRG
ncbi:HEAT repeat domain-containing protein [Gemmata sp. JC673]|uniref:HEAT repeat domain-containing protein n=1 Tax=Gemmata algarum TaxID=2975278 RepID=A0ABU5EUE8_9BACT|nr:HEAT repeat domain-containing protein [Gemmata algarum]MDY3558918.1 HEAT repeat domain-containing protein [Gemmata algarum]